MSDTKSLQETAIEVERARRHAKIVVDAEERPPRPPLQALTLAELFDRPAPQYVIDQVIPERSLIQIVGEPGVLKTFFAQDAGLSVASGQADFFGYSIVRQGAVLFIAAEGAGAFQFRVRAWCFEHNVDPLSIPFRVIPMPVNLRDPSFQQELLALVTEMHPILVIVDTLSRCTPGAEENSARDMGEVVGFCSELQQPSGAAIAFVHHPTKNDPKGGGRGSGVIYGAVDTEIRITTNDEDEDVQSERLITVTCAKQKDDIKFPPLNLVGHLVPVRDLQGHEMVHESGRPITSIVLRPAERDDVEKVTEKAAQADHATDLKVLRTMQDYPAATNQQKLRTYAGLNLGAVTDSVGRILRAGWAVQGKRGKPFTVTDAGIQTLETPF